VEYAGDKNFYEVDASNVPAEWHGWLHGVVDAPPGKYKPHPPLAIAHGSSNPYKRNLGGVVAEPHTPNLSNFRPRGYGEGNGLEGGSVAGEERYYTQPGWAMDPRNPATRRSSRAARLGFTLADTPATLRARTAARAGLSPEDLERYTSNDSEVRIALITSPSAGVSSGAAPPDGSMAAVVAAVGLPEDPVKREFAARVAGGTGHARPWSKELEAGTFAAAVSEVLTPEEEAFLAAGHDEDDLLTAIAQYQGYIDAYARVPVKVRLLVYGWGVHTRASTPHNTHPHVQPAAGGGGGRGKRNREAGRGGGEPGAAARRQRQADGAHDQVRRPRACGDGGGGSTHRQDGVGCVPALLRSVSGRRQCETQPLLVLLLLPFACPI